MSKIIVQFGAGNIGRSLVGFIFSELGYRIVFVEKRSDIVELLNQKGEYKIVYRENENGTYMVRNVSSVNLENREKVIEIVRTANFISTAVGAVNLSGLAGLLYGGLKGREDEVNILICENLKNSSDYLKKEIEKFGDLDFNRVGLIESSIAKMVPDVPEDAKKEDPLVSWAEKYSTVYVSANGIRGDFVKSERLVPVSNFEAYYNRKIYISNMAHTLSSVLGFINGYKHIAEALSDERISKFIKQAVRESENALKLKYPFMYKKEEDIHYSEDFLKRLKNPFLMDTVYRGGRDIQRKLAPGERLVGPTVLYYQTFKNVPENLAKGIAASLYFEAPGPDGKPYEKDILLKKRVLSESIEKVFEDITKIDSKSRLGEYIIKEYKKGKKNFLSEKLL